MNLRFLLFGILLFCVLSINGKSWFKKLKKKSPVKIPGNAVIKGATKSAIKGATKSATKAATKAVTKHHVKVPKIAMESKPPGNVKNTHVSNKVMNSMKERAVSPGIEKRSWASIVVYGGSILIRTTSIGLQIGALATGGCSYYPSICDDMDAIDKLDDEITKKKADFDDLYYKSADNWVNLRDANNNNGYINYYINESMRAVSSLADYQQLLDDKLQLKVPELFSMYNAQQNISSEDYLEILVGQLDFSMDKIQEMIEKMKNCELIGLIIQFTVETSLDIFTKSYAKAYDDVLVERYPDIYEDKHWSAEDDYSLLTTALESEPREAADLLNRNSPNHEEVLVDNGLNSAKISTWEKFKMAPEVLFKMYENSKTYAAESYNSLREWGEISTSDEFYEKSCRTLEYPISVYEATNEFIFNEESRKYTIENFELEWSATIMTTLGAITDVLVVVLDAEQWKAVADNMHEARKQYESFLEELNNEMSDLEDEANDQEAEWVDIIQTFKDLSGSYQDIIDSANADAEFADVLGLPRSPIESSNPLLSVDLDTLDKYNIMPTQTIYIDFLVANNNDLTVINDQYYALDILYSEVLDKSEENKTIESIESDLKDVYSYSNSGTVKDFGKVLVTKDVVCTCSILRVDLEEYDYYDLVPFRPICNISESDFKEMDSTAALQRNAFIMDTIVYEEVNGGGTPSLDSLLKTVKEAYSINADKDLQMYGESLTEQDIACSIATQFPTMTMYNGIDLTRFRPDCSAVTETDFAEMQKEADRLAQLDENVANSLSVCDDFGYCPCVEDIAAKYGATADEVKESIIRVDPTKTDYCGTGCECVDLRMSSCVSIYC